MTPFAPCKLPLYRLADQVGALLALVQHLVHSGKCAGREAGRGFLVVDLLPAHDPNIDDITNCYKPYFAVAFPGIPDII
jgi:hypothetical protein